MVSEREFLEFAAGVLGMPSASLSFETSCGSVAEWDSMAQLRLVLQVAAQYGVEIPFADVTSVLSLWEFYRRVNGFSPKKAVAVDLDGTLWRGVVGEDGPEGIRPDFRLLKTLKSLKDRGVLLVALSKNNEEDAFAGLAQLEASGDGAAEGGKVDRLTKGDFVTWRINWNEKSDNLRAVAEELNLGTEAFVFVDDNPAERLKMRASLPDVAVASFPPNLAAYFPERTLTEEDRRKTEEYRAEAKRRSHLAGQENLDVWKALGCRMAVHEMTEGEVARVAQLSQKANQFDVCTNRYSDADIRRLAKEGAVFACHVGDDFGDQGLVAFVVLRSDASERMSVVDWVMSCRVAGRGVEERFAAEVESVLKGRGVRELAAVWRDSGKNAPVRDLFDRLGFERLGESGFERRYRKRL